MPEDKFDSEMYNSLTTHEIPDQKSSTPIIKNCTVVTFYR